MSDQLDAPRSAPLTDARRQPSEPLQSPKKQRLQVLGFGNASEHWVVEPGSEQISRMVGASREMVSRVMKDFEEQGFIQFLDGGAVRVIERRTRPR